MSAYLIRAVLAGVIAFCGHAASAQDLQKYLTDYFKGNAVQFGYGTGVSSNLPRVDLVIHYCASGMYLSAGQSCRPNLIARGYQCTPMRDAGRWQIVTQGNRAVLQWASNSSGPGGIALAVRPDGVVVDPQGNPFSRVGQAQCR